MKITILQGFPVKEHLKKARALSKEEYDLVAVERRALQKMMYHSKRSKVRDRVVNDALLLLVADLLGNKHDVLITGNNLGKEDVAHWQMAAESLGAEFEVIKYKT